MADFAHSRTQSSSSKISNGNGFIGGVPGFSTRIDDYSEIFSSYNSSRASSIPFLDLPVVDETEFVSDARSSKFDYGEIFSGFDSVDYAVPFEELFVESKVAESSSEDVWTPAETGSPSEESSEDPVCSENNQAFSNIESNYAYDSAKQFSMSYHKTNQMSKEDGISGTTHIAQLNAVPAYTFVVDENLPFQKAKCDKPLPKVTNDHSLNTSSTDGAMDGEHFWETTTPQTACGSDQKPQKDLEDNDTYREKPFLTVSDINLKTGPSGVPPPSRTPPRISIKKGPPKLTASETKSSANYIHQGVASDASPPFFDVEVDLSSSAAASAAAMKEAMEKAQARLKTAKEMMERKKDGLQHRKRMGMKEDSKGSERTESVIAHDVVEIQEEKSHVRPERREGDLNGFDRKERQRGVGVPQVAPDLEIKPRLFSVSKESVDHKHSKERRLIQESLEGEVIGEWKAEEQFYELVKKDTVGMKLVAPENNSNKRTSIPAKIVHEQAENAAFVEQEKHDGRSQAAKIASLLGEDKRLNVPEETRVMVGNKVEIKEAQKIGDQEEHDRRQNEARDLKESEKKQREVLEREEQERKQREARKQEKKEAREREEYEKKLKEDHERKELEKKVKEDRAREENEKKMKEAREREEYEKKLKEAREREEYEKKLKEARERKEYEKKLKEAREREEQEKKLKEHREREENEKKRKEAIQREEDERRQKEAREREETEKKLEAREREEIERRQEEASQREENGKKINQKKQEAAREREENERKQKEAQENYEIEKRVNEEKQKEENERSQREANESEENVKRLKEAHERQEIERRLQQAAEENESRLKEVREREENERRQKEHEREENENKFEVCYLKKENERNLKQAALEHENREREIHEHEGNEKIQKGTYEQDKNLKSLKVPCEEVTEELVQKETCETVEHEKKPRELLDCSEFEMRLPSESKMRPEDSCKLGQSDKKLKKASDQEQMRHNKAFEREEKDQRDFSQDFHACNEENDLKADTIFEDTAESQKFLKAGNTSCKHDEIKISKATSGGGNQEENKTKLQMDQDSCGNNEGGKDQDESEGSRAAHVAQSSSEDGGYAGNHITARKAKVDANEKKSGKTADAVKLEKDERCTKVDLAATDCIDRKKNIKASQRVGQCSEDGMATEVVQPIIEEEQRTKPNLADEFNTNEGRIVKEREQEKERLRKLEEDIQRERERDKNRIAVERVTREARERAYAEVRERAERAAVERATTEARQRAMAEARERLEKACLEAREKSLAEKAHAEARLRAERVAVERATAEARERAEKAMAERVAMEARERIERSVSEKFSATSRDSGLRHSSSFSDMRDAQFQSSSSFTSSQRYSKSSNHNAFTLEKSQGAEVESAQRCKARVERNQRMVERAAKALAEKNLRDHLAQREQAERNRLAETLDADVKRWSNGKEGNLRALLSTLQYILGPESGWQPVPLTDIITAVAIRKAYRKATLYVHPDKLQQRGASIQQKYICEKVFDLLKDAWNKFNSEER